MSTFLRFYSSRSYWSCSAIEINFGAQNIKNQQKQPFNIHVFFYLYFCVWAYIHIHTHKHWPTSWNYWNLVKEMTVSQEFFLLFFLCCMWQSFLFHHIYKAYHWGTENTKEVQFPVSCGHCFKSCRIVMLWWFVSFQGLHAQLTGDRTISTHFNGFHFRLFLD